jgi:acyl-CoA thioester hydrolase
MTVDAPLALHREAVRPEWIDYNGHMNVAYYVLAFDHATDAFFDFVGVGADYARRSGYSTFSAEAHITYRREVRAGDPLGFTTQLLGYDAKRMHYISHMHHETEGWLASSCEWMCLHVDLGDRRVAPWPAPILARLEEIMASHRRLPRPPEVGRVIGIPAPVA